MICPPPDLPVDHLDTAAASVFLMVLLIIAVIAAIIPNK